MEASKVALNIKHEHVYDQLTLLFEVSDEISFGAESANQFIGHMPSLFGSHKLILLLLNIVHSMIIVGISI